MSIQEELWIAEWPSMWRFESHLWRLTTSVGRGLCDFSSRRIWWGPCVRDCVSSSLNTQPLQADVLLSQQLELVYQIIVFTKPTGSISSTLLFPHSCVDEPDHYCLKNLTKDFLYYLNPISSVTLSSACLSCVYAFCTLCLSFISSWWLSCCTVMLIPEYFRCL